MLKTLHGTTALITGASAGIGREFACQLAPIADSLILVARREERLHELEQNLKAVNPDLKVYLHCADLTSQRQRKDLIKWIDDGGFPINLLINNAGTGDWGSFESADWKKLDSMLKLNVVALTHLSHALLPVLRKCADGAAILNVSSVASAIPLPHFGVYAATKAYVTSLSEALREELRGSNVGVTTLCPGPVTTEFGETARRNTDDSNNSPAHMYEPVELVVDKALDGLLFNRARVVPGWKMAILFSVLAVLPMILVRLIYRLMPQDENSLAD